MVRPRRNRWPMILFRSSKKMEERIYLMMIQTLMVWHRRLICQMVSAKTKMVDKDLASSTSCPSTDAAAERSTIPQLIQKIRKLKTTSADESMTPLMYSMQPMSWSKKVDISSPITKTLNFPIFSNRSKLNLTKIRSRHRARRFQENSLHLVAMTPLLK